VRLTPIQPDGSWVTDVTTGNGDEFATQMAAFVVSKDYWPPMMAGEWELPQVLFDNSIAYIIQDRPPLYRTIEFSGYTWNVKFGDTPISPGPNYFTDDESDVYVDENGLHLKIVYRDSKWYCSEVFTTEPLGIGTYRFTLASPVDTIDKNVVIGLFTWDVNAWEDYFREIDIEFSRWGLDTGPNAQYVVQPWGGAGNRHQFDLTLAPGSSVHEFTWLADSIQFMSTQDGATLHSWTYTGGNIPPAGPANARINVWLMNQTPPSDGQEVEIVVEAFEFIQP
jgi:hypothetical protein